ncbi:p115 like vesicle tethering protein [Lentinula aciculospora]|uniref:P115 like vesicle tethering protein n=1 Tax=Lentinula aciculospora TaxID=153920 RepID=A0A9W9A2K8_9AGAR|nr:p115 like vesicle tethering protein [Lentinula aciculospora]
MEFLSQTYVALRGPTGAPQTATETVGRLSDRLQPATLLADRRAAVLALKGLSRDCKEDVGTLALPGLLQVLYNDAEVDPDIGKAVLETLDVLCEVEDQKELGFKHTDAVLVTEQPVHSLFALLAESNFYTRFGSLQLLSTLLHNRRQVVQSYFLTAPAGPASVTSSLEDKREIVRNEAISMVQLLVSQSADIQKVLAFEGAFEKLFNIIRGEGGVEGGAVAHEALLCVDGLLRFNSSNQSYFRETGLPPLLPSSLLFPPNLPPDASAPQEFALQFWDEQKLINAKSVVAIIGLLVGSKGYGGQDSPVFARCLIEIALASNAPTTLKTQALHLLPANLNFPLSELIITPYMPVPETNGEEWDRLEAASALDALIELGLNGEYNGMDSARRFVSGLELRTAAVGVFENFVRKEEIKYAITSAMVSSEGNEPTNLPPAPLLQALSMSPETSGPLDHVLVSSTHFASLLFSHLLRSSPRCKNLARSIKPLTASNQPPSDGGNFFVPADGPAPPAAPPPVPVDDEDDDPQTLIQVLAENLSLAFLSRSRTNTSDLESREWDRLIVGYLTLLSQWLWEDPAAVRDFLNSGGLGILVEPINQVSETDFLISSLCVFLLGIMYEYNREPGEITRATISPILNRLGVDTLLGRMSRLREDDRFKNVSPETLVQHYPGSAPHTQALLPEGEVWFDWAFVDFWKSNYYTIQRGLSTDPNQLASASGPSAETAMLIASLQDTLRNQSQEIEDLRRQLQAQQKTPSNEDEISALKSQVSSLRLALQASEEKQKETEKEQEDLLVLLEEVTAKRKRDKKRMLDRGLEVSEDEAEGDDDGGED